MPTIKTDQTPYIHKRTGERYISRHIGLMKIGHTGDRNAWVQAVFYQKADNPSAWFSRDLAAFAEGFVEERELLIEKAAGDLGIDHHAAPKGRIENWFVMPGGDDRLAGDIREHYDQRKVGTDAITSKVRHLDREHRFAITENSIYELVGDEVTL